jgi:hypothetical protein
MLGPKLSRVIIFVNSGYGNLGQAKLGCRIIEA